MSDESAQRSGSEHSPLDVFERGAALARELLGEFERLRGQLAELELARPRAPGNRPAAEEQRRNLLLRIKTLTREREEALARLARVDEENREFAQRTVEYEAENNHLAALYVASYQLHSSLDRSEVVQTILEIVVNLIGAERFALFLADDKTNRLEAIAAVGDDPRSFPGVNVGEGPIGAAVEAGDMVRTEGSAPADPSTPLVVIPLSVGERRVGAIAIYRLLEQKDGFTPLDWELLDLLGGHAATAVVSAQLYAQAERKRHTIQGFIDLLTR